MRKTKIICTIGPASESFSMLQQLAEAGMNIVRLNMSHGDHESHTRVIKSVRTLNKKLPTLFLFLLNPKVHQIVQGTLKKDLN